MTREADAIIIGAGISGLSLAYYLKKQGLSVVILESSERIGGSIDTRSYENTIYECGPNTFMSSHKELMELVSELGLEEQLISRDFKDTARYLYMGSKLVEVNPLNLLFSNLLSLKAKLRILLEPLAAKPNTEESVDEFISRKFGLEPAKLAASFLRGVWGADAKRLSSKATLKFLTNLEEKHGSIFFALIQILKQKFSSKQNKQTKVPLRTLSFSSGMQALIEALADAVGRENILLNAGIEQINFSEIMTSKTQLCFASKAFQVADILQGSNLKDWALDLAWLLRQVKYAPIYVSSFTLDKKLFKSELEGFGFLSHIDSGLKTMGTIWSSQLFEERKLADKYLFISYSSSPRANCHGENDNSGSALAAALELENLYKEQIQVLAPYTTRTLGLADFEFVSDKYIEAAIPQYEIGHLDLLTAIAAKLKQKSNIHIVGNYLSGISLVEIVKLSKLEALRISKDLAAAPMPSLEMV